MKVLGLPTLSMLLFGCGTHAADFSASQSNPVITRVAETKIPYPVASVSGRLSLRHDCLMIGEGVVFWPAGTSWDDSKRQVVFGGDLRNSPTAPIDSTFTGGGGLVDLDDDMRILDSGAEAALRDCVARTGATHALLAYPDKVY